MTEQKRAEAAALASEERLASIIEGTSIGTWEWNIQSGETVFNERWAEIVGYTLAELAPVNIRTWMELVHPDDLRRSNELLQEVFAGHHPHYDTECRMKHKDGTWVWVHDRGKVVAWTEDGRPLLMVGTHADITRAQAGRGDPEREQAHAGGSQPAPELAVAEANLMATRAQMASQAQERVPGPT